MSEVVPLTPSVIQGLRTDFRQGTWSASTQQFFNALVRNGNSNTASSTDQAQQIALLGSAVLLLQAQVAVLEAQLEEMRLGGSLAELTPRDEVLLPNFDLGWTACP
jgi:hypothetical protein